MFMVWENQGEQLWARLGLDARLLVMAHQDYDPACHVTKDPHILWRIIRETHFTNVGRRTATFSFR